MKTQRDRSLRRAGVFDAALLAALYRESFVRTAECGSWNPDAIAGLLATPGYLAWVAQAADRPAGFVLVRSVADTAEILSLAVTKPLRRRRVATELLATALGLLAAQGAERVSLEVAEDNVAAQALYRSLGFAPAGRQQAYYGCAERRVDAVIYRCELGAQDRAIPF